MIFLRIHKHESSFRLAVHESKNGLCIGWLHEGGEWKSLKSKQPPLTFESLRAIEKEAKIQADNLEIKLEPYTQTKTP